MYVAALNTFSCLGRSQLFTTVLTRRSDKREAMLENVLWNFAGQTGNFAVSRGNLAEDHVFVALFKGAGFKLHSGFETKYANLIRISDRLKFIFVKHRDHCPTSPAPRIPHKLISLSHHTKQPALRYR